MKFSTTNTPPSASSFAALADGFLIALTGWLAYFTRWSKWDMPLDYLSVVILGAGLVLILLPVSGAYRSWRGRLHWRDTGNLIPGLVSVAVILMLVGTLTKSTSDFSRLWMGYWSIYSITALFSLRWCAANLGSFFSRGEVVSVRVLLVGEGDFARSIIDKARAAEDMQWEFIGRVSYKPLTASEDDIDYSVPAMSPREMEALVAQPQPAADEVWIAMDNQTTEQQREVIDLLQDSCLTVRYIPDLSILALLNHVPSEIAGMMVIDLNASPLTGPNALIKAVLDKLFALTALAILAPVLALIALLIKRDSRGPVLFRQPRHGGDGKIIQVLKFRTMHDDVSAPDHANQAQRDDPRITRIGAFLRRTSLDELPQFVNVLKGDMSVVGPRPHPVALNKAFIRRIDAYMQRHRVKPGITGWAQIHGLRGETETLEKMQQRVKYDLYYIEHWSIWLDMKIIARTVIGGWGGKNAY
ncbi:undecaprenyl-phosphate glucose phosphotransferase [Halioglobus sp.]|nr:undecaprenyl-phosphate glucose phosphotransferase [Halioglobus sp.]